MTQTASKKIDPKPAHARNNSALVLGPTESYREALARVQAEQEKARKA